MVIHRISKNSIDSWLKPATPVMTNGKSKMSNSVWQIENTYVELTNHRGGYLAKVLGLKKRKVLGY